MTDRIDDGTLRLSHADIELKEIVRNAMKQSMGKFKHYAFRDNDIDITFVPHGCADFFGIEGDGTSGYLFKPSQQTDMAQVWRAYLKMRLQSYAQISVGGNGNEITLTYRLSDNPMAREVMESSLGYEYGYLMKK